MAIALSENDLFAVYSLPGESKYTLIKQDESEFLSLDKFECLPDQSGFIIHPFRLGESPSVFIGPDFVEDNLEFSFSSERLCSTITTTKAIYKQSFEKAHSLLTEGSISKVVLSRIKALKPISDIYTYFYSLVSSYENAFVFLYNIPGIGSWIGASPELLLKENGEFSETVALAGTKQISENRDWTEKEKEEQRLVEVFFENHLQNAGLYFDKAGPESAMAGKIEHLKSIYNFSSGSRFLEMADLFHPSPAISGTPQHKSMAVINEIESHKRKYYCGYLGPHNINEVKSLYINLRSMEIFKDSSLLYLGGGLTVDSDAELEWKETENKSETLSSIIEKT